MKKNLVFAALVVFSFANFVRAEDAAHAQAKLSVEVKIGSGIADRRLTGEADTFPAGTAQLVGWSRVTGAREPEQIMHVWKLNGAKYTSVPLIVKTSPYNTHSRITTGDRIGKWTLEVQDMDGNVLGVKDVETKAN